MYPAAVDDIELYDQILRLNAAAVQARHFEVAYHLLAAALHAAEASSDLLRIDQVVRLADQQGSALESVADHPMSASNAKKRGNNAMYESLVATARAKFAYLETRRLLDQHRSNQRREASALSDREPREAIRTRAMRRS